MEAEPNRLAPGDAVRARITVGEPDRKAQDGRVCLLYVNTYEYESTDSDGDTTVSTAHKKVAMAQSPLFGTGGPVAGTFDVSLRVPEHAPPSARETVEWKLEAILDRKGSRDIRATTELFVASAPTGYADQARRPTESHDDLTAQFDGGPRETRAGATVSGTVTVTSPSGLEGRALHVRVRGTREDADGQTTEYDGQTMTLAEPAVLEAGVPQTYAFSVDVPDDGPPTFTAEHNALAWAVEVSVDRRMRRDPTVRLPIVVRSDR